MTFHDLPRHSIISCDLRLPPRWEAHLPLIVEAFFYMDAASEAKVRAAHQAFLSTYRRSTAQTPLNRVHGGSPAHRW